MLEGGCRHRGAARLDETRGGRDHAARGGQALPGGGAQFRLPAGCATARGERDRGIKCRRPAPTKVSIASRWRLLGISYRSQRFVGPTMTPAILCSTGVHSMPNPGVGWIPGVPITLIRATL